VDEFARLVFFGRHLRLYVWRGLPADGVRVIHKAPLTKQGGPRDGEIGWPREIHSSSLVDGRAPSVALYTFNLLGTKSFSPLEVRWADRTRDWEELPRRAN
jgi:hypothetical protein